MENSAPLYPIFLWPNNIWDYDEGNLKQLKNIWTGESMIAKNEKLQKKNSELEKTVIDLNQKIYNLIKHSDENKRHLEELKYRFSRIWNERNSIFEHNLRLQHKVNCLIKKKPKRNSKKKTMTLF